jgi:1-acyl-sn-glycerol-3-phosphate acyltransferase
MFTLLCRLYLKVIGWKTTQQEPIPAKCVMIAAPHTTNWDFPVTIAMARVQGIPIKFLAKAALFKPPLGWLMTAVGGVSVNRSSAHGMVAELAGEFGKHDVLHLIVPAEGTRSKTEYWKSGFYRIAREANVPVLLAYVDGPRKQGGFGPVVHLTGDVRTDMDVIRQFYADKEGLKPNNFGPVRLKDEDVPAEL